MGNLFLFLNRASQNVSYARDCWYTIDSTHKSKNSHYWNTSNLFLESTPCMFLKNYGECVITVIEQLKIIH